MNRRALHYILDDAGQPVACDDVLTWARWFNEPGRRIVEHTVAIDEPPTVVSTVFLGIDHGLWRRDDGDPLLWETMVWRAIEPRMVKVMGHNLTVDREWANYQERYSSLAAARAGHERAVLMAIEGKLFGKASS